MTIFSALWRCLLRSGPFILGALAFLIFSSGQPLPLSLSTATAATTANQIMGAITNPSPHARVPQVQTVAGTVTGLTAGQHLWLLVEPHVVDAAAYHPQPDLTISGNDWSVSAHIGLAGDVGRVFDLELVVADNQADASFRQYLNTAIAKSSYLGMAILPEGALLLQSIEVQREAGGGGLPWLWILLFGVGGLAIFAVVAARRVWGGRRNWVTGDD